MTKLKSLLIVVFLLAIYGCQENLDPFMIETNLEDAESQHDPNLPDAIFFETPGNSFYIGQTVIGWDNKSDWLDPGEANNSWELRGKVNTDDKETNLRTPNPNLELFQNGLFVRALTQNEVAFSLVRLTSDPSLFVERFEWTIPSTQPTGVAFQLKYRPWNSSVFVGDPSPVFSIVSSDRIEIAFPSPWRNTYGLGDDLIFNTRFYCTGSAISVNIKTFKGQVLVDHLTFNNLAVGSNGRVSISSAFELSEPDYSLGSDYSIVFEMVCNNNLITHTEYFQILPNASGGIAPIGILPGG